MRSEKVMAKAFNAGFQRIAHALLGSVRGGQMLPAAMLALCNTW
jgi:hypothetical protein